MFFTHHSIKNNLNPCIKTEPVTNGVDAVICVCLVTSPIAVTGSGFSVGALRLRLGQCILPIAFHRKLSSLTQLTVLQHNINSSIDSFTLKLKFLIGFISNSLFFQSIFLWFLPPLCDGQFLSSVFNNFSFSSTCFWDMPSVYLFLFMTSFLCCLSVFFYNLSNSVAVSTSLLLFPFLSYVSFLTVSPSVSYLFSCFCLPVSAISGSLIMLSVPLSLSLLSTLTITIT